LKKSNKSALKNPLTFILRFLKNFYFFSIWNYFWGFFKGKIGLSKYFVYISRGKDLKFINFLKKNLKNLLIFFILINLYIDNSEVWEKVTLTN